MSTTQPIRDKKSLQSFRNFYRDRKEHLRNYTIIVMGLNTALRINDILHLTYDMVYQNHKVRSHIVVKERKTGKENRILLNSETRHLLAKYRKELIKTTMYQEGNPYLFPSPKKSGAPLSRYQAYRMITAAAKALNLGEHISCHSLRKTFGYHAWKQGANQVMLMTIFNHSSFAITRRYLCIDQDEKDSIFRTIYQNAA
ncbi:MAG: tyrosine-type recombinase/integrase [Lachnospiraceae bacterium]|nr:tyrosine-type recombinase/integrase [Lachnospiraceae bacterium]